MQKYLRRVIKISLSCLPLNDEKTWLSRQSACNRHAGVWQCTVGGRGLSWSPDSVLRLRVPWVPAGWWGEDTLPCPARLCRGASLAPGQWREVCAPGSLLYSAWEGIYFTCWVFWAELYLDTYLQPFYWKLSLVLTWTPVTAYVRWGNGNNPLTLCVQPENINHQCCLKLEYQISLLTSWRHVKVKKWLQKVLKTFVFSIYMYRHTHAHSTRWTSLRSSKTTRLNLKCSWLIDTLFWAFL